MLSKTRADAEFILSISTSLVEIFTLLLNLVMNLPNSTQRYAQSIWQILEWHLHFHHKVTELWRTNV